MKITDYLSEDWIAVTLTPGTVEETIDQLVEMLANAGRIDNTEAVKDALLKRENVSSTGVGHGVALPHARCPRVYDVVACCGICPEGTDFNALDNKPVHIFFVVLSPQDTPGLHLKLLAAITRCMADENIRHRLQNALTRKEVLEILNKAEKVYSE